MQDSENEGTLLGEKALYPSLPVVHLHYCLHDLPLCHVGAMNNGICHHNLAHAFGSLSVPLLCWNPLENLPHNSCPHLVLPEQVCVAEGHNEHEDLGRQE